MLPRQSAVVGEVLDGHGQAHRLLRALRPLRCHACRVDLLPGALLVRKAGANSMHQHTAQPHCLACAGCLEDTCRFTKTEPPRPSSPAAV